MLILSDLTFQFKNTFPALPVGQFFVVDNTGADEQPTLYSFGTTHSLIYGDPTS